MLSSGSCAGALGPELEAPAFLTLPAMQEVMTKAAPKASVTVTENQVAVVHVLQGHQGCLFKSQSSKQFQSSWRSGTALRASGT